MVEWFRFVVFTVSGIFIGIIDFRTNHIPDRLLGLLGTGLIVIDGLLNRESIPCRLLAAMAAFGLFYGVYKLRGGLGYGDVKYAGVIGYYLGPWRALGGLCCAVVLGLGYWYAGHLIFRWGKEHRFAFGPWLGCGAVIAALVPVRLP